MSTATFQQTSTSSDGTNNIFAKDAMQICRVLLLRCTYNTTIFLPRLAGLLLDQPGWRAQPNVAITGQKNESRKELSLVAETLEVSISNQGWSNPVMGPTVCASASSLFWCMCIAHLNHSKPGNHFFAPRRRVNTQREEKNWQGKATVLILQECGVLLKCHNSESSLLNPLIQSQGDNYHQLVDFLDPHPFASVADPVASIASSAIPLDLLVSLHACLLLLLRSSTLLPRRCVAVIGQIRFICSIVPSPRFTHDTNPLLLFLFDHHPIVPGRNESSPSAAAATPHPPLPEFQIPSSLYRHWYIVSSLVRWKCIGVGVGTGIIIAHRRQ